jgi:hypothetical protein
VTDKDFHKQQAYLLDWIANAQDDKERQAAHLTLNNLHQMHIKQQMMNPCPEVKVPKRRKVLTKVEKFDRKNSRREAIMAQRARHG